MRASKLGTVVRLPDGRVGTTVFNGLCGVGIKWGVHHPDPRDFEGSSGGCFADPPEVRERLRQWEPDAMLRDPYPSADIPCVGEVFEIVEAAHEPD